MIQRGGRMMKTFNLVKVTAFVSAFSLTHIVPFFSLGNIKKSNKFSDKTNDLIKSDWVKVGNDMRRSIINYDRTLTYREKS